MDDTQPGKRKRTAGFFGSSLKERLEFEMLLAALSARFVNLPVDQIDAEIEDTQRRICEFLDIDRSTLWQVYEGDPEGALCFSRISINHRIAHSLLSL